jgi:hypothetical protein
VFQVTPDVEPQHAGSPPGGDRALETEIAEIKTREDIHDTHQAIGRTSTHNSSRPLTRVGIHGPRNKAYCNVNVSRVITDLLRVIDHKRTIPITIRA